MLGGSNEKSFAEAEADCQARDMQLLSVRSKDEQDWVEATYPENFQFIWLGARESTGPWTWLGKQHRTTYATRTCMHSLFI